MIKLQVLMAGNYDIARGAKISFHLDEKLLYIASCEGKSFGIASEMISGEKEDLLRLGSDFSGVVLRIKQHLMDVKVSAERNGI